MDSQNTHTEPPPTNILGLHWPNTPSTARFSLLLRGEGRNAVHAAQKGLEAVAFDISNEGSKKALKLAEKEKVSIRYEVGDFLEMDFTENSFEAAALIYAHFPPPILRTYHRKIASLIKPNGLVILEGFSKNNLPLREKDPKVGGPNRPEMLFSVDSIKNEFPEFEILELEEVETELSEGAYHNGIARVIRFVGKKRPQ
jgi:ubiquinone/menaquinone biosynthesis C-methylase UbiE